MKKLSIVLVAVVAAALAGCARNHMTGPASLGDGTYIIGSYSKALSSEKVKMLQKAEAFCKDQDLIMKPVSITVVDRRTNQKTAIAVAETILSQAGNIELVFTCDRLH